MAVTVLALDPGAERMGWACLQEDNKNKPPIDRGSGFLGVHRTGNKKEGTLEPYQDYRLRVIEYFTREAGTLLRWCNPTRLVSEIVPVVGGGNFVAATQSQLASTAATCVMVCAVQCNIPVVQVGATTVKKNIGGHQKATKVKIRDGVFSLVPEVKQRQPEWKIDGKWCFDVSDAYGIGLTDLGYKNGK